MNPAFLRTLFPLEFSYTISGFTTHLQIWTDQRHVLVQFQYLPHWSRVHTRIASPTNFPLNSSRRFLKSLSSLQPQSNELLPPPSSNLLINFDRTETRNLLLQPGGVNAWAITLSRSIPVTAFTWSWLRECLEKGGFLGLNSESKIAKGLLHACTELNNREKEAAAAFENNKNAETDLHT